MTVALPSLPLGSTTETSLRTSAVDHTPYLGGPIQRLARLGDRWRIKVQCRPMYATQAATVTAILLQGLAQKVTFVVPQAGRDLTIYTDDATVASAVASGRVVPHSGGGATKFVGQFVSIVKNGVRYLHQITDISGANLTLNPAIKVPLAGGEQMEFRNPKIEGFLSGNEQAWTTGLAVNVGLTFEIGEAQ